MTQHPEGCACRTCRVWDALRSEGPAGSAALPLDEELTPEGLERHARRFGPELVEETAAEYGIEVKVERPRRRRAARGPTLKARVADYVAKGHSAALIAELENLSPSRARRLVAECSPAADKEVRP